MSFPFQSLHRFPDVEADNLHAYDATDRLLGARGLDLAQAWGLDGSDIAVIGDAYGAITLQLASAGLTGVRVHQDLATGRAALAANAAALGLDGSYVSCELDSSLLAGARLVLAQLPRGLAELEEMADAVARWAAPHAVLVSGGRIKHMTLAMNEVLRSRFADVRAGLAVQKSRLLTAAGPLPVPEDPPFPVCARDEDAGLTLCAHGGAFAGSRLDIGTRYLMGFLEQVPEGDTVDLGCGTGALAVAYALSHPSARVVATDRSAAAVRSARATVEANGLAARVVVEHDDAGGSLGEAAADVVLLNPPFHLGASVHAGAGLKLIAAAGRLLRPGGELWCVANSHLDYGAALRRSVGPTEVVGRNRKFTVTRSVRRPSRSAARP
ncbi:class I SAM-dependent methyltransferase [Sinomonas cellulolyticus]|uniref:Methyltransferase n=1 Tax=Sinomonas cellulolyticus TaxID=2801916 RepID=A0ABS1K0I3_9MICC|nr:MULTISPECIES: methyltransferase [Sinomonas]MBL0705125.1 methyltransferase [Sinomonas cellulolyticus]